MKVSPLAEITTQVNRDQGETYRRLTRDPRRPVYEWVAAPATLVRNELVAMLSPQQVALTELAGEKFQAVLTRAPGNDAPIGGRKVVVERGWFSAQPSEPGKSCKSYAGVFPGPDYWRRLLAQAQQIVGDALTTAKAPGNRSCPPSAGGKGRP